jgi:prophage maintenance system killer protein
MASVLHIDVPWLLQRHEEVLPDQPTINDFSALVAAVARHRVDPPRLGVDSDPAWRAAALLHTLALLRPLPSANARFACATAVAYMFVSGAGIDPPYGALVDLARDLMDGRTASTERPTGCAPGRSDGATARLPLHRRVPPLSGGRPAGRGREERRARSVRAALVAGAGPTRSAGEKRMAERGARVAADLTSFQCG